MICGKPMNRYNALDLVKFLMALCVIAIHTSLVKEPILLPYSRGIEALVRMAVPFFFMTSGYFLFSKLRDISAQEKCEKIDRYILRMIRLYILWNVVYLPITIYGYGHRETPLSIAIISFLRGFVLYGEQHMSWQLWYLLSTVYSMIAIRIMIGLHWKEYQVLLAAILVYCGSIVIRVLTNNMDCFSGRFLLAVKGLNWLFPNGRIFTGILYLAMGMYIANHPKLQDLPWYLTLAAALPAFAFTVYRENEFAKQILYISFFLFVLSVRIPGKNGFLALRRASTITYFIHMIFVFVLSLLPGLENRYLLKFVLVTIASLTFSCGMIQMEKKGNRKSSVYLNKGERE